MTIDTSREAVERLLDGVTEGPWSDTGTASGKWSVDYDGNCGWGFVGKKRQTPVAIIITKSHSNRTLDANARFIAASRELVPALLASAEAALAEVARLKADRDNGAKDYCTLMERHDALQVEVSRLSTPPDDAEVRAWALALDETARGHDDEYEDTGHAISKRLADEAREVSGFLTRLSHTLAAETAKRGAMETALTGLLEPFGDDPCRYDHHGKCQEHFIEDDCCVARARATLAKHGSKT